MAHHCPERMRTVNVETLIRRRITLGAMPPDVDTLLMQRGTLEDAARDLAQFADRDEAECLAAIEAVYL